MPNYNKVLLMGNLTRDVELKYTPGNQAVANIGIAINRRYRGKDNEMKEEVTFVDCEAWGNTAENISKFFSKGRPIFLEGRLKLDQWQDKEGGNRSKLKVVVETFDFVDSKSAQAAGAAGADHASSAPAPRSSSGPASKPQPAYTGPQHEALGDDEIPF